MLVHIGAQSQKKPHYITTSWFSEVVNDHLLPTQVVLYLQKIKLLNNGK